MCLRGDSMGDSVCRYQEELRSGTEIPSAGLTPRLKKEVAGEGVRTKNGKSEVKKRGSHSGKDYKGVNVKGEEAKRALQPEWYF